MTTRQPFCAVCGKTDTVFYDGLCANCYQKDHPLIIEKEPATISVCPRCNSYHVEHKWIEVDTGKQSLEEILTRAAYTAIERSYKITPNVDVEIRITLPPDINDQLKLNRDFFIDAEVLIDGKPHPNLPEITTSQTIPIKIHPAICTRCLGIHRGYYEALLQVRGGKRRLTEENLEIVLNLIYDRLKHIPRAYIPEINEVKGGVDVQVSYKHAAHQLANMLSKRMNATLTTSSKVTSIKDGIPVTRLVIAVTLPAIWIGDYIHTEKGLFLISKLTSDGAFGIHQQSGKRTYLTQLEEENPLNITKRVSTWLLVSKTPDSAQIMDMESYVTHEIPLFPRLEQHPQGVELLGFFLDQEFYVIDENPDHPPANPIP